MDDDVGPIRPEHATDGWCLNDGEHGWWLARTLSEGRHVRIYATTPTTTAWTVTDGSSRVLREASARDIDDAKSAVEQWIRGEES